MVSEDTSFAKKVADYTLKYAAKTTDEGKQDNVVSPDASVSKGFSRTPGGRLKSTTSDTHNRGKLVQIVFIGQSCTSR